MVASDTTEFAARDGIQAPCLICCARALGTCCDRLYSKPICSIPDDHKDP